MAFIEKLEGVPNSAFKLGVSHTSRITLVVRDGITGEIKQVVEGYNNKIMNTYSILVSYITGDVAMGSGSFHNIGLGSGAGFVSTDTALSGLLATGQYGPTAGRLSTNVATNDGINWNLSCSFSGTAGNAFTAMQAGILASASFTVGLLWLKATFASVFVDSTDILNVSWLQSVQSA